MSLLANKETFYNLFCSAKLTLPSLPQTDRQSTLSQPDHAVFSTPDFPQVLTSLTLGQTVQETRNKKLLDPLSTVNAGTFVHPEKNHRHSCLKPRHLLSFWYLLFLSSNLLPSCHLSPKQEECIPDYPWCLKRGKTVTQMANCVLRGHGLFCSSLVVA